MEQTITLNNGVAMPQLGFGVWQIEDEDQLRTALETALEAGYRAIDTAAIYGNEEGVGSAVNGSGIARDELFITSKLWNSDQGYETALRAFDKSLEKLQLDYLDLYLIHWPASKNSAHVETWRALEELYKQGRIKAIGVSNFKETHLETLLSKAEIVPAVNQVELHPRLTQMPLREYCESKDIRIESWSPLMQGGVVLSDEVVQGIAHSHGKTPAQIVLRWHVQHGLIVIPKSATPERIKENIDIYNFKLSEDEIKAIDGLNADERIGPDPDLFNG